MVSKNSDWPCVCDYLRAYPRDPAPKERQPPLQNFADVLHSLAPTATLVVLTGKEKPSEADGVVAVGHKVLGELIAAMRWTT
jgi:hypothetical protein